MPTLDSFLSHDGPLQTAVARWRAWWTRRRIVIVAAVLACIIVPPTVFAAVLLISYAGSIVDHAHTRGRDALWLGHAWVDGRRTLADVTNLAQRLRSAGIRDAYVHIGPLDDDGTLNPGRYPNATRFLGALAEAEPDIVVQAWPGNVVGNDRLDLSSRTTRAYTSISSQFPPATGTSSRFWTRSTM